MATSTERSASIIREDLRRAYWNMTDNWDRPRLRRKQHTVEVPLSPEFLAKRAAFQQMWEAMTADGVKRGYLGKEDGGEVFPLIHDFTVEVVYDESETELAARTGKLVPEAELKTVTVGGDTYPVMRPIGFSWPAANTVLGSWSSPI